MWSESAIAGGRHDDGREEEDEWAAEALPVAPPAHHPHSGVRLHIEELPHEAGEVGPNSEAYLEGERTKKRKRGEEPSGPDEVVEEDVHLCTSFCDFLIDLSSLPRTPTGVEFQIKVEAALENCEPNHWTDDDTEGTLLFELRGLFDWEIDFALKNTLSECTRTSTKYVNFIVGCKAHGIGKGNLRNMVLSLLDTDKTIKLDCTRDVSIVSVEVDRERDYYSVPWYLIERKQPHTDAEHSQENEPVSFSAEVNKMSSERNEKGPLASSNPLDTIISEPDSPLSLCDGSKDHGKTSAAASSGSYLDQVPPLNALQNTLDTIICEPGSPFSLCDGKEDHDRPSAAASTGSYLDQVSPLNALQNFTDSSEDISLCTVVCDFLAGLKKPAGDCWKGTYQKVLACLEKSCSGAGDDFIGSCTIDLRGRFADEAERIFIDHLNGRPSQRYLSVIVGCKLHGIGEGKLRNIVCEMLELIRLKSSSTVNGSIITIQLDDRQDYTPLSWISQPYTDVSEDSDDVACSGWAELMPLDEDVVPGVDTLVEILKSSMEEDTLCTFVCDFLSDLPTPPGQWWDKRTTKKILAGLGRCYRSESVEDVEGTLSVDIRGQYVDETIIDIVKTLYRKPAQKYLDLIVGCKVHGIGKGKLKNAISEFLMGLDVECVPNTEAFVISIELSTANILLIEKMMSGMKVPHGIDIDSGDHLEFSEDFLCTILCDLLFDIPKHLLNQHWDVKLVFKVFGALRLCGTYFCTQEDIDEGTYAIDLRGEPAHVSERELVNDLVRWSPYMKRLNFIVGCTKHGVGEGKLMNMVVQVLNRDKTIKWDLVRQAIISVELDGEKDYDSLEPDLKKVNLENRWPSS